MGKWIGTVEYADGERTEREFPYKANGNYEAEQKEQYDIECRILENAEKEILFYSVDYVD